MPTGIYVRSEKQKEHLSNVLRGRFTGENHPNWKGGKAPLRKRMQNTRYTREWRKAVFERDGYTCQSCGQKDGDLHADHIKSWRLYPDLRLDINNGRTLCAECHRNTESWGSHGVKQ